MSTTHESGYSPPFRVSLDQIDYTVGPSGPLDNVNMHVVPILRVYGNSSTGSKTCVHIHQVYPYFFIDYVGSVRPKEVKRYIHKLVKSLNHAIALSLKRNPESPKSQYIRAAILVKGVPFYGFHSSYSPYLKIYVADPALVNRAVTILRSGIVMKARFRIYESHLSFPLQFMCDFGLYGCGFLDMEGGWERCNDETDDVHSPLFQRSPHFRQSTLPLEIDVIAPQILNRHALTPRPVPFTGGDSSSPAPPDERLVLSVKELWEDESKRRRAMGLNPSPEIPVELSDKSRGAGGDWVAEARYWEAIRKRIESEATVDFSKMERHLWEYRVMTTFESIEALWEDQWKTWKPSNPPEGQQGEQEQGNLDHQHAGDGQDTVEIDMEMLSSQTFELPEEQVDAEEPVEDQGQEDLCDVEDEEPEHGDEEEEEVQSDNEIGQRDIADVENPFKQDESSSALQPERNSEYRLKTPPLLSQVSGPQSKGTSPTPGHRISSMLTSDIESDFEESKLQGQSDPGSPVEGHRRKRRGIRFEEDVPDSSPRKRQKVMFSEPGETAEVPSSTATMPKRGPSIIPLRTVHLSRAYHTCAASNLNRYQYSISPPTHQELNATMESYGVAQRLYRVPYYSNPDDVPDKPKEYGGLIFHLKGDTLDALEDWAAPNLDDATVLPYFQFDSDGIAGWEYASHPPTMRETKKWLQRENRKDLKNRPKKLQSQIEGPTQANIYGFDESPARDTHGLRGTSNFTILSLEVFAPTGDGGLPDPEKNEIAAVFYALQTAGETSIQAAIMAVNAPPSDPRRLRERSIEYAHSEIDLINNIVDAVVDLDPDIITGWEIQKGLDLSELIGRAPHRYAGRSNDQWGFRKTSTFQAVGRHVFNTWRIMRSEQTLTMYSFENVVFHVLRRRFPKYSQETLSRWYRSSVPAHTFRVFDYLQKKSCMVLEILEETEVVTKTAEFARVFGIDFFSVISRGSQFKVESFMLRIAKPESFVLISPSKADVGKQNAAECMPLIMEPNSAFYTSPMIVLDFQSLYPSVMIAYNYCYSTCLGRVHHFQGTWKFGVDKLNLPEGLLGYLKDDITVAPNGIMYVKSKVRQGLLCRMLTELLDTRVMVKQAMKGVKNDKALKRVLDARQLALKFIANVTYGYTSATFSGRMPAVEIADSIVQTGRETLEKAIMLVNNTKKWNAQVVYGDTDSMFIYLRGRTKEEAFRIGHDIADTVTAMNPVPIKLKFEKVYLPCVLMAKKRYVGFKYESIDASEPGFDAKGIETVRRDGVLAQRKMTEKALKLLFRTQDLSQVKDYCQRSWTKLLDNKASPQDFVFAKEVRMGTYSDNGVPPPGVMVAARKMLQDPNYEPQYAERIPYVIAKGERGVRLVDRAMDPTDFLADKTLELDAEYYIERVLIPPLERIFNLVGADVKQWYQELPRAVPADNASPKKIRASMSPEKQETEAFNPMECLVCGEPSNGDLCYECHYINREETIANLGALIRRSERRLVTAQLVCASCTGSATTELIECESLDCPWFYDREKQDEDLALNPIYDALIKDIELGEDPEVEAEEY
ncbi:delta DNA polymerase [Coprinopsis cinerea AmutBmut pab1-1]|nr:delta DNA polymerase [Coprinopsis cinerea AmutBmut pab1-1]